jgi:hypothetical protein
MVQAAGNALNAGDAFQIVSSSQEVRHFRGAGAGRPRFLNGGEGAPAQHRPRLHGIRIAVEMRR